MSTKMYIFAANLKQDNEFIALSTSKTPIYG